MELSDEHEGIIELPSGEVGERFADWLAAHDPAKVDPVIEIAITPNRGDALGVRGIARDLAARGLGTLKPLHDPDTWRSFTSPIGVTHRRRYAGRCAAVLRPADPRRAERADRRPGCRRGCGRSGSGRSRFWST